MKLSSEAGGSIHCKKKRAVLSKLYSVTYTLPYRSLLLTTLSMRTSNTQAVAFTVLFLQVYVSQRYY